MAYTDIIRVKDLEVFAHHGVLEEEKQNGQNFYVSFDAYVDIRPSAKTDNLDLSVSYADMCSTVKAYMTSKVYDLIETVAEGIAKELLTSYDLIDKVKVTLKKPSAPIGEKVDYPAIEIERGWHTAYIGIGSNIGDSKSILRGAVAQIKGNVMVKEMRQSTLIETEPWGNVDQASFLNGVIEFRTLMSPRDLMTYLLDVEQQFDRKREMKWGPRTLDLDILLYDDLVSEDPHVIVPHPLMCEREFVLNPLSELVPYKVHPLLNKRIQEIYDDLIGD